MENTFAVQITKVPGGSRAAISDGYKTVADLFKEAFNGENPAGYQFQVDGENVSTDYTPEEGDRVTAAKMVKGN